MDSSTYAFEGELFDEEPVIQSDTVIPSEQHQRDYDFEDIDDEGEEKLARRLRNVRHWFNDKLPNKWLPKDGYLNFEIRESEYGARYPDKIKLAGGVEAQVKSLVQVGFGYSLYEISAGKETVYAKMEGGRWLFYQKLPAGTAKAGDVRLGTDDHHYRPTMNGDLARIFTEAWNVANDHVEPKFDPVTVKKNYEAKLNEKMLPTVKEADELVKAAKNAANFAMLKTKELGDKLQKLKPLIEHGDVVMTRGQADQLLLRLRRPGGITNGEWEKLQRRFGTRLENQEVLLQKAQARAKDRVATRNREAMWLHNVLNQPEMAKYLSGLPPEKRLAELGRYASALVGTPYGDKLAKQIFGPPPPGKNWPAVDKGGMLRPDPDSVGVAALLGAYDSPASAAALKNLALTLAPHIQDSLGLKNPMFVSQRMFEIAFGRKLTNEEEKIAYKLSTALRSAKDFEDLVEGHGAHAHAPHTPGLVGEMLAKLGEVPHSEAPIVGHGTKAGHFLEKAGPAVQAGAVFFTTFAATQAIGAAFKDASVDNVAVAIEAALRTVGTYAEIAHALELGGHSLVGLAKKANLGAATIGMVLDLGKVISAKSPEARVDAQIQAITAGVILFAVAVDAPAVVVVALGAKIFGDQTSDGYDKMYGRLDNALDS